MPNRPALYNYTKLEYLDSILENGIYASKINDLNDPYENYQINDKERYRVACLTTSHNAKLMWSHYGNKHQGCIVKIILPDDFNHENHILKKVTYSSKIPEFDSTNPQKIVERLYTKDKKWETEKEYRAVCDSENYDIKYWKEDKENKTYYFKVKIEKVILGCNANYNDNYKNILKSLKDKGIKVEKMKMAADKFLFIHDKDFDINKEI